MPIELPKGTNIKYTKQISDIFDLANVSCSFTNSFEFPFTPRNTQAMQQLGISGDSSNIPYIKNDAILKSNGFDLISKGWFNVASTDDNYKGSVINGMIDFFKAIENKTMGKDLNLSDFNHDKLISTVVNSFTNDYYKYIVADYGGKNLYNEGINIDYQAPSFSVRKLWELIFSTFNFNCDYTNLDYIEDLWITYPKDVFEGQMDELVASLVKGFYVSQLINLVAGVAQPTQAYSWDTSTISEGSLIDNWKYVIPETTSYNFDLKIAMYVKYRRPGYKNENIDPEVHILKNGISVGAILSPFTTYPEVGDERTLNFNLTCDQGDIIEVRIYAPANQTFRGRSYRCYEWHHDHTFLDISKTDLGTVRLENELKDFLIKDFIKEILWRTGLTPIYEYETNTVKFITLNSRLDFDNAQDLSNSFVKRGPETYQNDYAQKNVFALKKNDDTDLTGDGYLYVYNRNLEDEKTLVNSKIYAPDKKIVTDNWFEIKTNQYKIWQLEIKEDENFDPEARINYKGLSGRFYFIRKILQDRWGLGYTFTSQKLNDAQDVDQIYTAINTNTLFEEAIYNNYAEYQKIFTNFRIHNIELVLTENDFIGLDLTKPVFFKQENAYYICNKIPYEEGSNSTGEFIKINKL